MLAADKRHEEEKKQPKVIWVCMHACMREQGRQVGARCVGPVQLAEVVCVGLDLVGHFRPVRMD